MNDKAAITAYYDEQGFCHTVEVRLNAPGLGREDVAEAIRAVFLPGALPVPRSYARPGSPTGYQHTELGSTDVIPQVAMDGATIIPGQRIGANGVIRPK